MSDLRLDANSPSPPLRPPAAAGETERRVLLPASGMRALRIAVLAAAGELAAMFVYVVGARIRFPYELEWMCGSSLDHIERVRHGLPVYAAPTTRWIPYLYPPLFYWIGAWLGGGYLACRILSLVASAVQAGCIFRLARRAGASLYWAALGVLLFIGCYFYVGYWYDLERCDTLCVALILLGTVVALEYQNVAGAALAGAVLGIAYYAKQQAVPFAVAGAVALALDRAFARAAALGGAAGLVVIVGTWLENRATGGWFRYYVVKMPLSHGIDLRLWRDVWDYDVAKGPILIALTFAFIGLALWRAFRGDRRDLFLGLLVAAAGATSLSSRLHIGGWINVLQFWTSFACVGVAVLGARLDEWVARKPYGLVADAAASALLLVQLTVWFHSPADRVPDVTLQIDTDRLLRNIHRLEKNGEVLVVGRGHVTSTRHFQMSALADENRTSGPPADLVEAIRDQRLAAIVDDARPEGAPPLGLWPPVMLEDIPQLKEQLFASYYVAESFDEPSLRVAMAAPAQPRWAYRPRRNRLSLTANQITHMHFAEMRLAARRSEALRSGDRPPFEENDIEELAAHAVAAAP